MDDLVEKLRAVESRGRDYEAYRLCIESAARIEALEAKIAKWEITDEWERHADEQSAFIEKCVTRVDALEAALREIEHLTDENAPHYRAADIARAALKKGE